jgi:uncharacterized membrane-anchored protein
MNRSVKAVLLAVVVLLQLGALTWMIRDHERVLERGTVYKFRTEPIDPRDPFRGEYVILNFEAESGSWPLAEGTGNSGNTHAYGLLGLDSAGFARITALSTEAPAQGEYLSVSFMTWGNDTAERIALPFDRYFLQEGDGAATESMLQPEWDEGEAEEPLPAYAVVRVLNGKAVIEDLVIGDRPLKEWLKEFHAKAGEAKP